MIENLEKKEEKNINDGFYLRTNIYNKLKLINFKLF